MGNLMQNFTSFIDIYDWSAVVLTRLIPEKKNNNEIMLTTIKVV